MNSLMITYTAYVSKQTKLKPNNLTTMPYYTNHNKNINSVSGGTLSLSLFPTLINSGFRFCAVVTEVSSGEACKHELVYISIVRELVEDTEVLSNVYFYMK